MFTSIEMRWFYPGAVPSAVQEWWSGDSLGKPSDAAEEREDLYLYTTPMCEYLNMKLRQGRIEVKWRKAELGLLQFGDRCQGKLEKWVKWMCEDSASDRITPAAVSSEDPWIAVQKKRSQRLYKLSHDTPLTLTPIDEPTDGSCSVEVTTLHLQDSQWWSLAFDVFGEYVSIQAKIQPAIAFIFKNFPDIELNLDRSFGYPKWLSLEAKI